MERSITQMTTNTPFSAARADATFEPAANGAALTVAFGVLVFWSAAGMGLDYLIGDNRIAQATAKALLGVAVCAAIPLFVVLSIASTVLAPLKRSGLARIEIAH
jgi:hypothetical protein